MNKNILAFENIKILRKKITTNDVFMKTEKIKKILFEFDKIFLTRKKKKEQNYPITNSKKTNRPTVDPFPPSNLHPTHRQK